MKKILLLLIAATLSVGGVSAQKLSKAERKAKKEAQFNENLERITKIFVSKELTFVPSEMQTNTSGRTMINKYQFLKLQPKYIETNMSYISEERGSVGRSIQTTVSQGNEKMTTTDKVSYGQQGGPAGDKGSAAKVISELKINTTLLEISKNEPTKYGYIMVIKVEYNQQKLVLTLEASARTNNTSLKIESNRNSDVLYKGSIREN